MDSPLRQKFLLGLEQLVDSILLQADLLELAADRKANVEALVVESQMTSQGALASMIVQQGTLSKGQVRISLQIKSDVGTLRLLLFVKLTSGAETFFGRAENINYQLRLAQNCQASVSTINVQ